MRATNYELHKARIKQVEDTRKKLKCGVKAACEDLGIRDKSYYSSKRKLEAIKTPPKKAKANKPRLMKIEIPDATPARMVALIGSPDQVMKAIRNYE